MKNNFSHDISVKCSSAWISGLKDWKLYRIKDEMEKIDKTTVYIWDK